MQLDICLCLQALAAVCCAAFPCLTGPPFPFFLLHPAVASANMHHADAGPHQFAMRQACCEYWYET